MEAVWALFLDLNAKQATTFMAGALKNHHPQGVFKTDWRRAYDGLVYIEKMEPIK